MKDIALSAVLGFAVGDAVGVQVKFDSREKLAENPVTDMLEYGMYSLIKGTWLGATIMMLRTLDSIAEKGEPDYDDIMDRLVEWITYNKFKYQDDNHAYEEEIMSVSTFYHYDYTMQTALINYTQGVPALSCGMSEEGGNNNSALLRMIPLVLYFHSKGVKKIYENAECVKQLNRMVGITHAQLVNKISCCIYAQIALDIINGIPLSEAIKNSISEILRYHKLNLLYDFRYDENKFDRLKDVEAFAALPENHIYSDDYVVHSLEAALWCLLNTGNYDDAVLKVVNLGGGETDINAAITGALAGLIYGINVIHEEWLDELVHKEFLDESVEALVQTLNKNISSQTVSCEEDEKDINDWREFPPRTRMARKVDWWVKDMPDKNVKIQFERGFTDEQLKSLLLGRIPYCTAERMLWYMEDNKLYAHRCRSGCCVFIVEFNLKSNIHIATVNREPKQRKWENDEEDLRFINRTLDSFQCEDYEYDDRQLEDMVRALRA